MNPRWASPVKNRLCLILGEIGIALYTLWQNNPMQGLTVTGLEIFSVFGVTAIAALVFPYSKKAKVGILALPHLEAARHPGVTWGAAVDLIYLILLLYYFIFKKAASSFTYGSTILFVGVWGPASSGTSSGGSGARRSAWTSP